MSSKDLKSIEQKIKSIVIDKEKTPKQKESDINKS